MLEEIIDIIKTWCLRYKAVKSFKYQDNMLINAQNNNKYLQCILDDTSLHQLNITSNIFKATFDLYILGFVNHNENDTIEHIQSICYDAAVRILYMIDNDSNYQGIIRVYDYSILTLSHYSDDNACGVKLTLDLVLPQPLDLCTINDEFNDESYTQEDNNPIDLKPIDSNINELILNPIKINPNKTC